VILMEKARQNLVGGSRPELRNVISGNAGDGVFLYRAGAGNSVQGNFLGTNAAGTGALPNEDGVGLLDTAATTIGGTGAGAGNLISGNTRAGIFLSGSGTTGTVVQGNRIGTGANGAGTLGNPNGVYIGGAPGNVIGGPTPAAANVIAFSGGSGIVVDGSAAGRNAIRGNAIFGNGRLGINLLALGSPADGVTPNDPLDADSGPNNLQNYPVPRAPRRPAARSPWSERSAARPSRSTCSTSTGARPRTPPASARERSTWGAPRSPPGRAAALRSASPFPFPATSRGSPSPPPPAVGTSAAAMRPVSSAAPSRPRGCRREQGRPGHADRVELS
jgi:hypothetical protein